MAPTSVGEQRRRLAAGTADPAADRRDRVEQARPQPSCSAASVLA
ncbi:hypothetical protein [Streptomyces sp. GD-15H]